MGKLEMCSREPARSDLAQEMPKGCFRNFGIICYKELGKGKSEAHQFMRELDDRRFKEHKLEGSPGYTKVFKHAVDQAMNRASEEMDEKDRIFLERLWNSKEWNRIGLEAGLEPVLRNPQAKAVFERIFLMAGADVTMSGRLEALDRIVAEEFRNKPEFEYLDVGVCPENDGAPTSEETARALKRNGNVLVIATDIIFPRKFKPPEDSGVLYLIHDIVNDELDDERFLVVRAANAFYQFSMEVAEQVHEKLRRAVVVGGLIITGEGSPDGSYLKYLIERRVSENSFEIHKKSFSNDWNEFYIANEEPV